MATQERKVESRQYCRSFESVVIRCVVQVRTGKRRCSRARKPAGDISLILILVRSEDLRFKQAEQPKAESRRGLWDRAYDDLRAEKKDLVEAFENMLSSSHEANPTLDLGDEDPLKREKQMSALVHEKLATMNDKRWRIQLCGRSVVMREQVDRVVKVILVAKDFINPFANLDPVHAGLPWAGVCMLLQVSEPKVLSQIL